MPTQLAFWNELSDDELLEIQDIRYFYTSYADWVLSAYSAGGRGGLYI